MICCDVKRLKELPKYVRCKACALRVPTPIEIVENYGDASLETICQEIFALTKVNWNSADFCIRNPITFDYASEVGAPACC
jgi:hypothetical protein